MKKTLTLLLSALLLVACANQRSINSKDLVGKYSIDMQPTIDAAVSEYANDENIGEFITFGKNLMGSLFSTIDLKINFYDNGKGVLEANTLGIGLIRQYTDLDVSKVSQFNYKIEHDSILLIQAEGSNEYMKIGVLNKIADNYDYLNLHNDEGLSCNLIKLNE